jgi:hypothetical protein
VPQTFTADNGGAGNQVTTYVYGTTLARTDLL